MGCPLAMARELALWLGKGNPSPLAMARELAARREQSHVLGLILQASLHEICRGLSPPIILTCLCPVMMGSVLLLLKAFSAPLAPPCAGTSLNAWKHCSGFVCMVGYVSSC